MGARWYDSSLGVWIQPDTIVPDPTNPQSLNRYMYTRGNPLRYRDPSGHDWQDVIYNVQEFAGGFLSEWAYVNTAQMAHSLATQPNESAAATAGRVAADVAVIYQGAEEMVGGIGLIGGGATACATGVLCPAGAVAVVGGAAVTAHGATVASYGAVNGGTNVSNLYMMAKRNRSQAASAPNSDLFGARGTKLDGSKTVWKEGTARIDIENPNPGYGEASLHYQEGKYKWDYDPIQRTFVPYKDGPDVPRWLLDKLANDGGFQSGINKGLYYLGEEPQW